MATLKEIAAEATTERAGPKIEEGDEPDRRKGDRSERSEDEPDRRKGEKSERSEDEWMLFAEWVLVHIPPMMNVHSAIVLSDGFPWPMVRLVAGVFDGKDLGLIPPVEVDPKEEYVHWTNYSSLKETPEKVDLIVILSRDPLSAAAKEMLEAGREAKRGTFWLVVSPHNPEERLPARYTNPYLHHMYPDTMEAPVSLPQSGSDGSKGSKEGPSYCIWTFSSPL